MRLGDKMEKLIQIDILMGKVEDLVIYCCKNKHISKEIADKIDELDTILTFAYLKHEKEIGVDEPDY